MDVTIRLVCTKLPGRAFAGSAGGDLHLGIQRGEEVLEAVPADRKSVTFEPTFRVEQLDGGRTNFLGPYAKGPRDERFFYLAWFLKGEGGAVTPVGRSKIHLGHLLWGEVEYAAAANQPIEMRVELTSPKGGPRFASIRPA